MLALAHPGRCPRGKLWGSRCPRGNSSLYRNSRRNCYPCVLWCLNHTFLLHIFHPLQRLLHQRWSSSHRQLKIVCGSRSRWGSNSPHRNSRRNRYLCAHCLLAHTFQQHTDHFQWRLLRLGWSSSHRQLKIGCGSKSLWGSNSPRRNPRRKCYLCAHCLLAHTFQQHTGRYLKRLLHLRWSSGHSQL